MALAQNLQLDVAHAKLGDIAAFERIIKQTQNLVSSIALSIVKDYDQSEDVTQQVFINAWKNLNSLKQNSSFLPWLRQTTRYTALNTLRESKRTLALSEQESDRLLSQLCTNELGHEEALLQDEQSKIIHLLLDNLPSDNRDILLLYYREGQSAQHVAELLDLSPENVRQRLSRARKQIKQELLSGFGNLLVATAPSTGFAALVIASISYSSPVVAATAAQTLSAGKTGYASKLTALLGGASIGAGLAAIAIFFSTKPAMRKMNRSEDKARLLKLRNQTITWVIFSGILLSLAYEFGNNTSIIGTFAVFAIGLFICTQRTAKHIEQSLHVDTNTGQQKRKKLQDFCGRWGSVIGIVVGFSALIIGLIRSGQLVL